MKNNDFPVYRMPPEGSFLAFSLLCAPTLLSYRSKVAEMGANAKEAVRREAERRICGYGKTGTFVNVNHGLFAHDEYHRTSRPSTFEKSSKTTVI